MLDLQNLHISRSSITIPLMIAFCLLLVFVLAGSKLGAKKAHACVEYPISDSTTHYFFSSSNGYTIQLVLWYDTCTSSNYAVSNVLLGQDTNSLVVQACRNAGNGLPFACGTQTSCGSTGVCTSGEIYSPVNTSYAIASDLFGAVNTQSF